VLRIALWVARAVAVVALVLRTTGGLGHVGGGRIAVDVAVGLCGLAFLGWLYAEATGWRRVVPIPLCVLVAATGVVAASPYGELAPVVALVTMPSAGSDLPILQSLGCLTAGALTCIVGTPLLGRDGGQALLFVAVLAGGLLIGRNRRAYRIAAEQSLALARAVNLRRGEEERNAVLGERNRIAREIHDVLAHTLGGIDVQVRAVRALLARGEQARAMSMLESVQHLTGEGLDEARRAVQALRTDSPSLPQALEELAHAHAQWHETPIEVSVPAEDNADTVTEVPSQVAVAMMRVAQEALTNSARHAPGRPVAVRLDEAASGLTLSITNRFDANRPREAASGDGYGLRGMQERLLLVGGTLTSGPQEDGSWRVVAHVPSVPERVDP
jgi:signal transduction histidine kinase